MEYNIDYRAINDYLNRFCSSIDGNFFDRNLGILYDLVYETGFSLENNDVNFSFGIFIHSNSYIINERIETIKTIHKDCLINFFFDINFILFF